MPTKLLFEYFSRDSSSLKELWQLAGSRCPNNEKLTTDSQSVASEQASDFHEAVFPQRSLLSSPHHHNTSMYIVKQSNSAQRKNDRRSYQGSVEEEHATVLLRRLLWSGKQHRNCSGDRGLRWEGSCSSFRILIATHGGARLSPARGAKHAGHECLDAN